MQESQRGRVRTFQNPQGLPLQTCLDEMPIGQKLPDVATHLGHPHCMAHSGAEEINLGSRVSLAVQDGFQGNQTRFDFKAKRGAIAGI